MRCIAGRGIEGDRFLDHRPGNPGQITFFAEEVFTALQEALGIHDRSPAVLRRNVLVQGGDLNSLIGREFTVQGLRFRGREECRPCYWMDRSFGLGAEAWLRQRGGLRAEILTDGILRVTSFHRASFESFVEAGSLVRTCSES